MSKLIDKLKRTAEAIPQPMGFGRLPPTPPKPKILLIASLTPANVDLMADYVTGADAGVWRVSTGAEIKALSKKPGATSDIPWGCWLALNSPEEIAPIAGTDFDFIIFPLTTSLAVLPDTKKGGVGHILQVNASLSEGLARTIEDLPVDAVLVAEEPVADNFLTWHQLMIYHRLANLLNKPLLAMLPPNVAANELHRLWEAGVNGVIANTAASKTTTKELRQQIEQLPVSPPRKRKKITPLLPQLAEEKEVVVEDEEEEE